MVFGDRPGRENVREACRGFANARSACEEIRRQGGNSLNLRAALARRSREPERSPSRAPSLSPSAEGRRRRNARRYRSHDRCDPKSARDRCGTLPILSDGTDVAVQRELIRSVLKLRRNRPASRVLADSEGQSRQGEYEADRNAPTQTFRLNASTPPTTEGRTEGVDSRFLRYGGFPRRSAERRKRR